MKPSIKFSSQSSGLSIMEKTSSANVKISRGRTSSTSTGEGGLVRAPSHVLDLFNSGSSASSDEAVAPLQRRKRPQKSPPPKVVPKPSSAPATKGISAFLFFISLRAAGLTLAAASTIIEPVAASVKSGAKDSGRGGGDVTE
jgi:hypothetical protein